MDETPANDVAKLMIEKYPVEEWAFITDAPGWISHWEWTGRIATWGLRWSSPAGRLGIWSGR